MSFSFKGSESTLSQIAFANNVYPTLISNVSSESDYDNQLIHAESVTRTSDQIKKFIKRKLKLKSK